MVSTKGEWGGVGILDDSHLGKRLVFEEKMELSRPQKGVGTLGSF